MKFRIYGIFLFLNWFKIQSRERVGIGLMQGLRIKDDKTLATIIKNCFEERVLVLKAGRNTLRFLPPLTITKDEVDIGFERVKRALQKI